MYLVKKIQKPDTGLYFVLGF